MSDTPNRPVPALANRHEAQHTQGATAYQVVRQTWLTRKPSSSAGLVAVATTFAIAMGSLFYELNLTRARTWMPASGESVFANHEYWRLFTTLFAHADLGHIASNSFLFMILGFFLYGYFGTWVFPLAAFIGGALTNWVVLKTYPPDVSLIGASGIVYWMGGAWLVFYFLLSRQKSLTQRMLRTFGVALMLFMPAETFAPNVSYSAHFVGFAIGIVFALVYYFWRRSEFLTAEVRETIIEQDDPEDDLPPGEGFSAEKL